MPCNKNAIRRIQVIDEKLSDGNYHSAEELVNTLKAMDIEVSKSQIYYDLKCMRDELQCPLKYIRGTGWYYDDYGYRLFAGHVQKKDVDVIEQVRTTVQRLSALEGLPCASWLTELAKSIDEKVGGCFPKETYIGFESSLNNDVINRMNGLLKYIERQQVIKVIYQPFSKEKKEYIIHPYYIKQYNRRLFLFGWNDDEKENKLWNLPLDRIKTITPVKNIAFNPKPTYIDFETYFNNIIGVTISDPAAKLQHIVLQFEEKRMQYVLTKPLHPSQTIIKEIPNAISIDVIPNKELTATIIYFGKDVKVLEPASLKKEIADNLKAASEQYS